VQLAWPFALVGAAIGWVLPARAASTVTIALVLGLFGWLVTAALERVRDWQVALLSPAVGALTGAAIGWTLDGFAAAAVGVTAGVGFGLMALPPLVLMTDAARRVARARRGSPSRQAMRRRIWLLALAMAAMAALTVPALSRPPLAINPPPLFADVAFVGMLVPALFDLVTFARLLMRPAIVPPLGHPFRDPPADAFDASSARDRLVVGECVTIDALLLLAVGSALLLAR
jgi:hypothetical protein